MNKYVGEDLKEIVTKIELNDILTKPFNLQSFSLLLFLMGGLSFGFDLKSTIAPIVYSFFNLYEKTKLDYALEHCDDIITLHKIYDEVIDDIVLISKKIDNDKLLEHYALLNYVYQNCYMSYNKMDNGYNNIIKAGRKNEFREVLCLNNHGVCRHTVAMNIDYLSRLGFNAIKLIGVSAVIPDITKEYYKKNYNLDLNENQIKNLEKRVYENIDDYLKKYGNHVITLTVDEKSKSLYYLDITQNTIYISDGKKIVSENGTVLYPAYNRKNEGLFKYEYCEPFNIMNRTIYKTNNKIEKNIDILDNFYKENKYKLESAEKIYQKLRVK